MRTILIDGDIIAYQAACISEKSHDWGEGQVTLHADEAEGKRIVDDRIASYAKTLRADRIIVAITDPDKNWRKRVLPTYKGNRPDRKPLILAKMKQHILDNHAGKMLPWLEGDDVLGIMATSPSFKGEKIIVSTDKDMKTIPGLLWNPDVGGKPIRISAAEADRWHMIQTLSGDATDFYAGCPGVGKGGAPELVDDPHLMVLTGRTLKSGPRKGEEIHEWRRGEACSVWECVVSYYIKAGLTEADALVQARVARILRASEYDIKKAKVKLWEPPAKASSNPRTATP